MLVALHDGMRQEDLKMAFALPLRFAHGFECGPRVQRSALGQPLLLKCKNPGRRPDHLILGRPWELVPQCKIVREREPPLIHQQDIILGEECGCRTEWAGRPRGTAIARKGSERR